MLSAMPSVGFPIVDFDALCLDDDVFPVFEPRVFQAVPSTSSSSRSRKPAACVGFTHGGSDLDLSSLAVGYGHKCALLQQQQQNASPSVSRRDSATGISAEFDAMMRDTAFACSDDHLGLESVRSSVADVECLFTMSALDSPLFHPHPQPGAGPAALGSIDEYKSDTSTMSRVRGRVAPLPIPEIPSFDFDELEMLEALRGVSSSPPEPPRSEPHDERAFGPLAPTAIVRATAAAARASAKAAKPIVMSPPSPDPSEWSSSSEASTPTRPRLVMSPARQSSSPACKRRTVGAATNARHASQRKHVCVDCGSRFQCKSKLDRHALIHTGSRPFPCFCGKAFNQKSALKNHTRRHVRKGTVPVGCNHVHDGLNEFTYDELAEGGAFDELDRDSE
jgi:hypothetical protein